jgi:hypothetical protein
MRIRAGAAALTLLAALVVGGAAAARTPTPSQKAAITAALRSEQGEVAIQKILVSTANPTFASIGWGFSNAGRAAQNNSVLALAGGKWKVLWTRESEQPADGACVYVPAPVAHDLLHVSCPPVAKLHATAATAAQLAQFKTTFLRSKVTAYAKTSNGLSNVCVSKLDPTWAAAQSTFSSGGRVYVWFKLGKPVYESLMQLGNPPPPAVVLSLASCVGYNPSDFGG